MLIELGVVFILSESCLAINVPRTLGFAGIETGALTGPPLESAVGVERIQNFGCKSLILTQINPINRRKTKLQRFQASSEIIFWQNASG